MPFPFWLVWHHGGKPGHVFRRIIEDNPKWRQRLTVRKQSQSGMFREYKVWWAILVLSLLSWEITELLLGSKLSISEALLAYSDNCIIIKQYCD